MNYTYIKQQKNMENKKEIKENTISYEIKIDNIWKEFILLKNNSQNGIEDIRLNKRLCELDNNLYGKYFRGQIGYNPTGWWQYVKIQKKDLRYKENDK